MSKKSNFDDLPVEPLKKVTVRDNAEETKGKLFRVTKQEEDRIKEACYLSGATMQKIVIEGIDLWIAKNLKGKM